MSQYYIPNDAKKFGLINWDKERTVYKAIMNVMQPLFSGNLNYGQDKMLLPLRSCPKTIIRRTEIFAPGVIIW